jgi:hypothetical protein
MANKPIIPIPRDRIEESFVWRDWFQKLSNTVYGSIATQDANNVNITGGTISNINFVGVAITKSTVDSTPIGNNSASTGRFTSIKLDTALAVAYGGTGVKTSAANYVFAGPTTGAAAAPSFRALVAADIPALPYAPQTSGTSILYGNGTGGFSNVTIGSGITFAGGTLSATGSGGTVTSVSVVSANGFAGTSSGGTTPALTLSTTITGLLKGNGTAISAATNNTDYMGIAAPVTKTADFTVANGEIWYINNKSGSTCVVTLPAASSWIGRTLTFKNMQAQLLNSATSNVVPIDSTTAGTAILLGVVGNWATLVSDGTNWIIMQAASNNNLLLE